MSSLILYFGWKLKSSVSTKAFILLSLPLPPSTMYCRYSYSMLFSALYSQQVFFFYSSCSSSFLLLLLWLSLFCFVCVLFVLACLRVRTYLYSNRFSLIPFLSHINTMSQKKHLLTHIYLSIYLSCHISKHYFRLCKYIGSLQQQILQGPVGIGVGVVYGFVFGIGVSKVLPSEKSVINNVGYKCAFLFIRFCVWGEQKGLARKIVIITM